MSLRARRLPKQVCPRFANRGPPVQHTVLVVQGGTASVPSHFFSFVQEAGLLDDLFAG